MAQPPPPQQFVVIQSPATSSQQPQSGSYGYNQSAGKVTGAIQLLCGVATITFGVLAFPGILPIEDHLDGGALFAGVFFTIFGVTILPMIAGVFFIVAGSLGAASRRGNGCLIGTYMGFSITSIVFAIPPLFFDSILASAYKCREHILDDDEDCPSIEIYYGMHVALVISIVVEIIFALAGSIICCMGVCCTSSNSRQTNVQTVHYSQAQANVQTSSMYQQPYDPPPPYNPNVHPGEHKY